APRNPYSLPPRRSSDLRWCQGNGPHLANGLVAAPDDAQPAASRQPGCDALVVVIANKAGTGGDLLPFTEAEQFAEDRQHGLLLRDRKSTRLNSSHVKIS